MRKSYRILAMAGLLASTLGCERGPKQVRGVVIEENETDPSIKARQTYVIRVKTTDREYTISIEPGKRSLSELEKTIKVGSQVMIKESALDNGMFRSGSGIIDSGDIRPAYIYAFF